uniref:ADH N n=1 Tax=Tremella fuciformis TaxID=64657 RepID=D5KY20_9TREE|nr:ADH N [Tremella fuciformis]
MRCILIKDGKGPASNLYLGEEATPQPKAGEAQVKIKAFGLNRMDILQREGKYPLPPKASKTILGVEFSGIVSALGEGSSLKEGDEVFGLAYGGAYAEYIVLDEKMVLPKPKELSWVQAAALPECAHPRWSVRGWHCGDPAGSPGRRCRQGIHDVRNGRESQISAKAGSRGQIACH